MNKFIATFAAITGICGLALTTRADVLYSLPIGISLIIISGVLIFVAIKSWEENANSERIALLEELSLKEIKKNIATTATNLGVIADAQNIYTEQILEQLCENQNASLKANTLLEQLTAAIDQQLKLAQTTSEAILEAIGCFDERRTKTEKELINYVERFNETAHKSNCEIVEHVKVLHSISSQTNESLRLISTTLQGEAKTFIEQQQSLYEIILEDIKETLTEFAETGLRNADDTADSIKRTISETNRALRDLPLSLETFGIQNAETMRKSADGFNQFESLINATVEQLTSVSNQDYELLKEMLK